MTETLEKGEAQLPAWAQWNSSMAPSPLVHFDGQVAYYRTPWGLAAQAEGAVLMVTSYDLAAMLLEACAGNARLALEVLAYTIDVCPSPAAVLRRS